MTSVVLVTSSSMPKQDEESHLLVSALERRGANASVEPWDAPVDWASADLVVVRTTWDYFTRIEEFLAWAARVEAVTRLVNPADVIRWNSHKSYLVDLSSAGVPTVPTVILPKGTTALTPGVLPLSGDVVVKPAVSIGAIGALRGPVGDPQVTRHLIDLATSGDVLVQPFISSVLNQGEVSLLFARNTFSHAVRKLPRPGEYRVQDHHGGSVQVHTPTGAELAVAQAALAVAPTRTAYARVDLVSTEDGPVVMELELIEPALFLTADADAADVFAEALLYDARDGGDPL